MYLRKVKRIKFVKFLLVIGLFSSRHLRLVSGGVIILAISVYVQNYKTKLYIYFQKGCPEQIYLNTKYRARDYLSTRAGSTVRISCGYLPPPPPSDCVVKACMVNI